MLYTRENLPGRMPTTTTPGRVPFPVDAKLLIIRCVPDPGECTPACAPIHGKAKNRNGGSGCAFARERRQGSILPPGSIAIDCISANLIGVTTIGDPT
jgi:hypothetical protein